MQRRIGTEICSEPGVSQESVVYFPIAILDNVYLVNGMFIQWLKVIYNAVKGYITQSRFDIRLFSDVCDGFWRKRENDRGTWCYNSSIL